LMYYWNAIRGVRFERSIENWHGDWMEFKEEKRTRKEKRVDLTLFVLVVWGLWLWLWNYYWVFVDVGWEITTWKVMQA
jgi:hypothetical protein